MLLARQAFFVDPCENVIASEDVLAYALPDELWADLYATEGSFRTWCDQQLWPQELLNLLEVLEERDPESDRSALERLQVALSEAKRCPSTQDAVAAVLDQGWSLYLASAWGDATVGQPVRSFDEIPAADRFSHRLVAFPPTTDELPSKGET